MSRSRSKTSHVRRRAVLRPWSGTLQPLSRKAGNLLSDLVPAPATVKGAGHSVLIGLVGRGIGSSRSPIMHEREGTRLGIDYTYRLIDFDELGLHDSALGDVIASVEALGFSGLNITHPFKQSALPLLTDLSPEASAIGAVNTVIFRDGCRTGHNTDSWGFAESFRASMSGCSLTNVLQFGAGGAGAAVAYALLELGVEHLVVFDTAHLRAQHLAERLNARFGDRVSAATEVGPAFEQASGVVNTTPIGMAKYPGLPFAADLLSPQHWVAEIVYFPAETALLRLARQLGRRTLPGIGMAVNQAARAFELFTGIQPDRTAMARHFEEGAA
jgi:shikimate dehydrogenase